MVHVLGMFNSFLRYTRALLTGGVNNDVASSWQVGDKCLARWARDGVWYNAEILEVKMEGFYVRFSDHGNEDEVENGDIVGSGSDIPEDGLLDAGVILPWEVGDKCIARWQEDSVWYSARVLEVGCCNFHVLFIDYGNEDLVCKEHIVGSVVDVPEGADIDDGVFSRVDQWIPGTRPQPTIMIAIDDTRPPIMIAIDDSPVCNLFITNNDTGEQNTIAITRIRELVQGQMLTRLLFEAEGETLIEDAVVDRLLEYCGAMSEDSKNSLMLGFLRFTSEWISIDVLHPLVPF